MKPNAPWTFAEVSRNVHTLHVNLANTYSEFTALLQSDVHWDNPHCRQDLFKAHLDEALKLNAPVLDFGDFFCAMQGKGDRRHSKSDVRPEHMRGNYLDALVSTASEFLRPYHSILCLRGKGNHETGVSKFHETDLTDNLVTHMKANGAQHVCSGGFSGWVRIYVTYAHTRRASFLLWYHHGYGGGGPVTRGTIQTSRQAVYLCDADIVVNGHTHDAWVMPIERIRLNQANVQEKCRQVHVRTPGYKDEYADGASGWHIERGGPPKPIGAAWLRVYIGRDGKPDFEIREAR